MDVLEFDFWKLLARATLITALFVIISVVFLCRRNQRYWSKKKVRYEKPWPFLGTFAPVLLHRESFVDMMHRIYRKHPQDRYVGLYQFHSPTVLIRDPDLIKFIAIKEFESCPEHTTFASTRDDPIWSKNLFAMPGGKEWRDLRAVLSPAFTGNKLRIMFDLIKYCAVEFANHLSEQITNEQSLEMKDVFSKVTNDIIASTAFGIQCNTLKDPENEIFLMGKQANSCSGSSNAFKFFVSAVSPTLAKFFKVRFVSKKLEQSFRQIVKETVELREKHSTVRPDMIQLLMEARKSRENNDDLDKPIITDDVLTAQAVIFFLAGFDNVSTAMSYTAYELALNPKIQAKLVQEIHDTRSNCLDDLTYDHLMGMKYMDMVLSEVLRKWPPVAVTDRKVVKKIAFEPKHPLEQSVVVDEGVVCHFPIYSLQMDPKYFPDPEKFDPQRFNEKNKPGIQPFTYIPFGVGPRNCIVEKTPIPLLFTTSNVNPLPKEGFWLGLKPRKPETRDDY